MRKFTFFQGEDSPPGSSPGGNLIPLLAGYNAGIAACASLLVKIKA